MRLVVISCGVVAGLVAWQAGHRDQAAAPSRPADWRTPRAERGTLTLERGWQGHFFVNGDVVGAPIRFLVDTGASTVALSRPDARRAGVDVDHLTFDGRAQTASGTVAVAATTLPAIRVGDIQILNVPAMVIATDEGMPLLGQSFLKRIDTVSIEGDRMTLTKL